MEHRPRMAEYFAESGLNPTMCCRNRDTPDLDVAATYDRTALSPTAEDASGRGGRAAAIRGWNKEQRRHACHGPVVNVRTQATGRAAAGVLFNSVTICLLL